MPDASPSSTLAPLPTPMNIAVRWINMAPDTARATRMRNLLAQVKAQALADRSAFLQIERTEAVVPICRNKSGACELTPAGASYYSETMAASLETPKARLHQEPRVRAALMGVWLSTVSAFKRFAIADDNTPYLMVLEDDAGLSPSFFRWLPSLLAQLGPARADFHVVRFSCWGARFEADRIAPDVYRAAHHPFSTKPEDGPAGFLHNNPWVEDRGFAYGGAHVTLVQRSTVGELIEHLLGLGIIPFDLSVRESVYGHTRPTATGNTRRKHTKIRSYVIDTSLAWDDRTLRANATREWRVPSKRAGANQSPDSAKSRAEAKLHGAAAG